MNDSQSESPTWAGMPDGAEVLPVVPAPPENTEVAGLRDRWMRAEAEIANVRTRARRDVDDARLYAVQKFATDVIEGVENLRRGLDSLPLPMPGEPASVTSIRNGLEGIERGFVALLARNGVERVEAVGLPFDAGRHQAMAEQESMAPPGTVVHAHSAGWTLHGRLLRPAMVVVAKPHPIPAGAPYRHRAAGNQHFEGRTP